MSLKIDLLNNKCNNIPNNMVHSILLYTSVYLNNNNNNKITAFDNAGVINRFH